MNEGLSPDIRPQRLRKLLHRLLDIYSPSGKEEEILAFLHGYLKRQGLPVLRQPVDEKRYNLLVLPQKTDALFALVGHVDTVAAYDLEHFGFREDGDVVQGLGAADMKGGCAAMVEAYLSAWNGGARRLPAALALVVGEEEEGDGAERLVEDFHFPWALIGEPTNLRPCLSHYGYIEIELRTFGKRKHASLATRKENAIEGMLHAIVNLSNFLDGECPEVVYNLRDLFSSRTGFTVPDRCEAWLDLHIPPSTPMGQMASDLEEVFARAFRKYAHLQGHFRIITIDPGYELPERGRIVELLKKACGNRSLGWKPEPFRSHSDANQLWAAGIKPLLLGAGRLESSHVPEESVSFQDVCLAAGVYYDLLSSVAPARVKRSS